MYKQYIYKKKKTPVARLKSLWQAGDDNNTDYIRTAPSLKKNTDNIYTISLFHVCL